MLKLKEKGSILVLFFIVTIGITLLNVILKRNLIDIVYLIIMLYNFIKFMFFID